MQVRMDVVPALVRLGFSEYDARAYVALVQRSPMNGYEVAKAAGIPRANVYAALERLAARGAVLRSDTAGGTRYTAVPPDELMRRIGGEFVAVARDAAEGLAELGTAPEHEPVLNVRGYAAVLEQARAAVQSARRDAVIAIWPQEAAALAADVAAADAREVAITTLCLAACERECGSCRGEVIRYRAGTGDARRRLVIVPDGAEAVAAELDGEDADGVRTRRDVVVEVCASSVRSGIALAAVIADLGDAAAELSPRTRAFIDAAAPNARGARFGPP